MEVDRRIQAAAPDIVCVGLSTPKQERWMFEHRSRLGVPVMAGVGAAFDFTAGTAKQAPVWMQENGLEWFFRLTQEPQRLCHRKAGDRLQGTEGKTGAREQGKTGVRYQAAG